MPYVSRVTDLIGNTPMTPLRRLAADCAAAVVAKLEAYNPGSSVKDRIAQAMIADAQQSGKLRPGTPIVEPTSGNTGIGLALVGRQLGYEVILTMPESMSLERRKLLRSLGAKLVLTDAKDGMLGAIAEADRIAEELRGFVPRQFENPANPRVHYETTGPEIWRDTQGKVDVLVAGVGTGGTVSGAGRFLKEQNGAIEVVAVEPAESAVMSGKPAGPHMIQGIGAGFLPKTLDMGIVDTVLPVSSQEAIATARALAEQESLLVGISSGAAAAAALRLARDPAYAGKTIAVVFPDTSERYASTLLFYDD